MAKSTGKDHGWKVVRVVEKVTTEQAQAVIITTLLLFAITVTMNNIMPLLGVGGKTLVSVDVTHSDALAKAGEKIAEKEGYVAWMPYIFSGMPAFLHSNHPKDNGDDLLFLVGMLLMIAVGMRSVKRDEDVGWGILGAWALSMPLCLLSAAWYPGLFLFGFVVLVYYEAGVV